MRRVETGEHHSGEVPLKMFQGATFKEKGYLDKAIEIVLEGVGVLGVSREEPIRICTGYVLTKAKERLLEEGFRVRDVKIKGATQELAERTFIESLTRLGIGGHYSISRMRSFDGFLGWVHGDLESRERYVKTGWSSWSKHRVLEENR